MPRRQSSESLVNLSIAAVAQNLELICYGIRKGTPEFSKFMEENSFMNIPESFLVLSELPGSLLKQLLLHIADKACLRYYLHAIIQPQLTQVCFSPKIQVYPALRLLRERIKKLQQLEIPYCKIPDPGYLVEFFKGFPLLEILNLRDTSVDDLSLCQIGLHCKKLRVLDVSHTGVTEKGVENLPNSLRTLNILATSVIPFGVYNLLRTHNNIIKIEYENYYEVCRCFKVMCEASGDHCQSSLKELIFLNCSSGFEELLHTTLPVFPALESLSIRRSDLSSSVLRSVLSCTNLRCLELGNSNFSEYTLYFCEHMVPILEQLGTKLVSLSLEKFKFVDVSSIIQLCPRLQRLKLSRILSYCNIESHEKKSSLKFLKELEILNSLGSRVTSSLLLLLLSSSPSLASLSLQFLPSLTPALWSAVSLNSLQTLRIEQCHEVTPQMMEDIILQPSSLQFLSCYSCSGIGEEERDHLNHIIKRDNLALILKWYSSRMVPIPIDLEDWVLDIENREDLL